MLVIAASQLPLRSLAQHPDQPSKVGILLVATPETEVLMESLASSLRANLSALPVSFAQVLFEEGPGEPGFAEATKDRMEDSSSSIAIWIHEKNVQLLSLQIDLNPFTISPQGEEPGSAVWEEVVSSKIHSEVLSLLPHHYVAKLMEEDNGTSQTNNNTPSPLPEAHVDILSVEIVPRPRESLFSFWGAVGYSPAWPAAGTPVYGARLALGLGIGKHLEIFAGGDLRSKLALEESYGSRVAHQIRLGLRLAATFKKVQLGGNIGAVLEISKLDDLKETPLENESTEILVEPGLGLSLFIRLWLIDWLGLYVEGGLDLFGGNNRYTLDEETMLETRPYRPSGAAGVVFRYRGIS